MKLSTKGYKSLNSQESSTISLKEIDKKVGYVKEEYQELIIHTTCQALANQSLEKRMNEIDSLLKKYLIANSFHDYNFCVAYLQQELFTQEELKKIKDFLLFYQHKGKVEFINLYIANLQEKKKFYLLIKGKLGYQFQEISNKEANSCAKYFKTAEMEGLKKALNN